MLASTTPASLMLQGHEITYSWTVQVDLPGGIFPDVTLSTSAIEIEASTTTDQPDGTRLQEGYAAQQATFTLAGPLVDSDATKTAAWLFNRYSASSPLYHSDAFKCPVRVYFNVYTPGCYGVPETFRKFTGFVEDYTLDDNGGVAFTCLDGRQLLRSVPAIPAVVTAPPFNAGLTSEFAVDALLRTATAGAISSWPAQPAGCVLSVGFRASAWPEVGSLPLTTFVPQFSPGAYGTALAAVSTSGQLIQYGTSAPITNQVYVRFIVCGVTGSYGTAVSIIGGVGDNFTVQINSTQVVVSGTYGTQFITVPIDAGPHMVEMALTLPAVGGSTATGTVWVDGTAHTFSPSTPATRTSATYTGASIAVSGGTLEAWQVGTVAPSTSSFPFVPQAIIDPSLNPLQVVPAMSGDPWQVIQQIAEAELAVARFDESTDKFLFQNRRTIAAMPVARTVSSQTSLETIGGVESTYASIVNDANVGYTDYNFSTATTEVWAAPGHRKVPARGSATWTVTLDSFAVVNLSTTTSVLPQGSADGGAVGSGLTQNRYRASVDRYGSARFTGTLTFSYSQPSANQITITVTNSSKQDAWLVASADDTDVTAGTPLFWIAGQVVTQADEQTVNSQYPPQILDSNGNVVSGGAASSRWGDIAWDGTGNPWVQDADAAAQLASDVVAANYLPLPNFTGLAIFPDPRIQLSDKLLVDDTDRTGVVEYVQVFGYTITWAAGDAGSGDTFEMSIDGRVIASPGQWILGVAGRSELGVTTYL